jgi:hypothetical protein
MPVMFRYARYYKNEPLMVNLKFAKFNCYQQIQTYLKFDHTVVIQGVSKMCVLIITRSSWLNETFFLFEFFTKNRYKLI